MRSDSNEFTINAMKIFDDILKPKRLYSTANLKHVGHDIDKVKHTIEICSFRLKTIHEKDITTIN